jgi:formylmethanofuran dehydrogenase subunit E
MVEKRGRATIESHTQYVRSRVQCPGCGERIPAEGTEAEEPLCLRCRTAR